MGDAALKRLGERGEDSAGATATAMPAPRVALGIRPLGALAAAWGLGGVALLLIQAMVRLTPLAVEGLTAHRLAGWQWALVTAWVAAMGWSEGYRGFQRAFSPRVVARALHLSRNPRPLHVLLAPLYCMGLLHASRRRLVTSWILSLTMIGLVFAVRLVPQPWRGVVDAGVVVGLLWGLLAIVVFLLRALAGRPPAVALELPDDR